MKPVLGVNELRSMVEEAIREIHFPASPADLYDPITYMLALEGKRMRPVLALAAANLFTDDLSPALSPALGLEVFHNFTLMHDDIMDNAPLRRGKQTVHEKWGVNNAILSGDVMMVAPNHLLIGVSERTSVEAAKQAIENDVHILGVSSLAAGHKTLVPEVIAELKKQNRSDIMVVAGGVIPQQDYAYLYEAGVFGIYGPGTKIAKAAQEILNLLIQSHE